MLSPRWRKILRDFWSNKTRMVLIVLSIAIGVFALGTISHMQVIVSRDLDSSYAAINPADATIYAKEPYDEDLLLSLRKIDGLRAVEGRYRFTARFRVGPDDKWHPIEIIALPDYDENDVNKIRPELKFNPDPVNWPTGAWPPPRREIVLERTSLLLSSLGLVRTKLGDSITVETADGHRRTIRMAGLAYDFGQVPATFAGRAYGYITFDTLEWFGIPRSLNTLYVRAERDGPDPAPVERVVDQIRDRIERNGDEVDRVEIHEYGKLPLDYVFQAISIILGALGALSLLLSGFLVTNTISALLSQQIRQIGVMKVIGARVTDLVGMYMSMVVLFGLIALVVAVPLALEAARMFTGFLSYFLNFQMTEFTIPPEALLFEIFMGLAVPVGAAMLPVLRGTRVTVLQAIQSYGLSAGRASARYTDALIARLPLPRPLLLSLRNTFRRQGRLILTLVTLILASATFVTVLNLRTSMSITVDKAFELWRYDVLLHFQKPYSIERIEQEALRVPNVVRAEAWGEVVSYRVFAGKRASTPIVVIGLPSTTQLLGPTMIAGRWLREDDRNAIVIDTRTLETDPTLAPGSEITLSIRGKEVAWRVVGIVQGIGVAQFAYASYPYLAQLTNQERRAVRLQIETSRHDRATQARVVQLLETAYKDANMEVVDARATAELREQSEVLFNIITSLLLALAVMLAAIGGLGLMGTMSLNVIERTREIGVLRAIGAPTGAIYQIVIAEGLLIGFASWLLGVMLALPLARPLSDVLGRQFFQTPLLYSFSFSGAAIWLALSLGIAATASFIPAQHAAQISVQMALNEL